jgi:hypothetical protein
VGGPKKRLRVFSRKMGTSELPIFFLTLVFQIFSFYYTNIHDLNLSSKDATLQALTFSANDKINRHDVSLSTDSTTLILAHFTLVFHETSEKALGAPLYFLTNLQCCVSVDAKSNESRVE